MTESSNCLRHIRWVSIFNLNTGLDYLLHTQTPAFFCSPVPRPRTGARQGAPWRLADYLWWHLWPRRTYLVSQTSGPPSTWTLASFTWLEKRPPRAALATLLDRAEEAATANSRDLPPPGPDTWLPDTQDFKQTVTQLKRRFPEIRRVPVLSQEGRRACLDIAVEKERLGHFARALVFYLRAGAPQGDPADLPAAPPPTQ